MIGAGKCSIWSMRMLLGAEAALVRPHFVQARIRSVRSVRGAASGGRATLHNGKPYDTLHKVIGKPGDGTGSLQDFGIAYSEVALT